MCLHAEQHAITQKLGFYECVIKYSPKVAQTNSDIVCGENN